MNTTRHEYIPAHGENGSSSNGNGSNGNGGHVKAFSIMPATDPTTLAILDARRNALADERLNRSMAAFFCEILDRSLNPKFFEARGVVTLSDTVLAEVFRVSNRTVYTWKRKLEAAGYVWLTQKWKSNMWPITTYHLTCLHRPQRQEKTDADGTYGGGKLRSAPFAPGLGCRKPGQPALPLPGSRTGPPESKSMNLQGISGATRKKDRLSAEEKIGSQPKPTSGESRRKDRLRAEEKIGSGPKPASGESRSQLPTPPEAGCRHMRDSGTVLSPNQRSGEDSPPDLEFEDWRKGLKKMFPRELELLKSAIKVKLQGATTPEAKQGWKLRLDAVDAKLYGGSVADAPAKAKPRAIPTPTPAPVEVLSEVERELKAKYDARLLGNRKAVAA